jgi:hypothetical protein
MNFIKRIAEGRVDEFTHWFFIRYSLGEYEKEPLKLTFQAKKLKVQGGFEYVNALHAFLAEVGGGEFKLRGCIVTSKDINRELKELGVEPKSSEKMRAKSTYQYRLDTKVGRATYAALVQRLHDCFLLFEASDGEGRLLKVKKDKPPKIGSGTPGFVSLELLISDSSKLLDEFLWDAPEAAGARKIELRHTYIIEDIEIPKECEDDPVLARVRALRKGKIKRVIEYDGKLKESLIPMEV